MASDKKPVIIKKIIKGGHGGHHGGSWKIAYADFVTAMMAFFLLMWLLSNTPQETKKQLAIYFQEFSLIDGPPKSITLGVGGKDSTDPEKLKPIVMEGTIGMYAEGKSEEEKMKEAMAKMIEERLQQFKDQLVIDTFDNGVRIQMLYDAGKPFFESGSALLTNDARNVLKVIADTIRNMPNKIAVEGHTDAKPFGSLTSKYTNWELSTDRASSARVILEEDGIPSSRMVRVAGYAATQPLIKDNPEDPRNRRVSILLFNEKNATLPSNAGPKPSQLDVSPLPSGNDGLIKPK